MRERWKLFFEQLFLLISSESTEQSQICVKNENPAMFFVNFSMDFLSVPEYVIKKDDLTDIDMVKSWETRNTLRLTS